MDITQEIFVQYLKEHQERLELLRQKREEGLERLENSIIALADRIYEQQKIADQRYEEQREFNKVLITEIAQIKNCVFTITGTRT